MSYLLIYFFFMAVNVGLFTVQTATGYDLGAIPYPDSLLDENTGTLAQITAPSNSTDGDIFNFENEQAFQAGRSIQIVIDMVTGGFVINVIDSLNIVELPDAFLVGIKILLGILLIVQLFYWFSRLSQSKMT